MTDLTDGALLLAGQKRQPNWAFRLAFETYGTIVGIESTELRLIEKVREIARKSFLGRLKIIEDCDFYSVDFVFGLAAIETGTFQLWEDGAFLSESERESDFDRHLTGYLRVRVAEHARPWVFAHAGVVALNGKVVVLPGRSFSGKTTLVAELIRNGADYYSDEYAVFDEEGSVHPFARDLSVRPDGNRIAPVQVGINELGGNPATRAAKVGLILFTEYVPGSVWRPERLTQGNAIKELIPHTIPIRRNTAFSMKVLKAVVSRAIMLKGLRSDAHSFSKTLLSFMEDDSNWSEMTLQ